MVANYSSDLTYIFRTLQNYNALNQNTVIEFDKAITPLFKGSAPVKFNTSYLLFETLSKL